jgi:LmbE family N-acetylglucosaminyl deacetylase
LQILALSPHTDDAELGAGASIHKWVTDGHSVHIAAFSTGDVITGATVDEAWAAAQVLRADFRMVGPFATHMMSAYRQYIIEEMIRLRKELHPDLVLCPSSWDCHQDHQVVHNEAVRAFSRLTCILGYDQPYNAVTNPVGLNYYVTISDVDLLAKINAVNCYVSQAQRPYSGLIAIQALATVRGIQCYTGLAEAFEVIRWIER